MTASPPSRVEAVSPVVQKTLLSVAGTSAQPVRNLHFQRPPAELQVGLVAGLFIKYEGRRNNCSTIRQRPGRADV
jgi:hypothetical protein